MGLLLHTSSCFDPLGTETITGLSSLVQVLRRCGLSTWAPWHAAAAPNAPQASSLDHLSPFTRMSFLETVPVSHAETCGQRCEHIHAPNLYPWDSHLSTAHLTDTPISGALEMENQGLQRPGVWAPEGSAWALPFSGEDKEYGPGPH